MNQCEKYLQNVLFFLKFRNRSEKEIRDYLLKKKAPDSDIQKVLDYCKKYNLIDDEKFAVDWINSRLSYRLKSKRVIKAELIAKGIDRELIDKAFLHVQNEEGMNISDSMQAEKIVKQKLPHYINLSLREARQKLTALLLRRGYDYDTAKKSIDDVLRLEYNNKQSEQ